MALGAICFSAEGTCKSESDTKVDNCGPGAKDRKSVLPLSNGLGEGSFTRFDVRKCQTTSTVGILPREQGPGFRSSSGQHSTIGNEANSAVPSAGATDGADGNVIVNNNGNANVNGDGNAVSNVNGNAVGAGAGGNVISSDGGTGGNTISGNSIGGDDGNVTIDGADGASDTGITASIGGNGGASGNVTTTDPVLTTVTGAASRVSSSSTQVSLSPTEPAIMSASSPATPLLSSTCSLIMAVAIVVLSIVLLLMCCTGVIFLRRRRVLGLHALLRGNTGLGHMDGTDSVVTLKSSVNMCGAFATLGRAGERGSSTAGDTCCAESTISPYPQFPGDRDHGAAQFSTRKSRLIPRETRLSREELSDAQSITFEGSQSSRTSHVGTSRQSLSPPSNHATVQDTIGYIPNLGRHFTRNKTYLPQDKLQVPDTSQTTLLQSDLPRNTSQMGGLALNVRRSQGPNAYTPLNANNEGNNSHQLGNLSSLVREMDEVPAQISDLRIRHVQMGHHSAVSFPEQEHTGVDILNGVESAPPTYHEQG